MPQKRAEETRNHLLDAAALCFASRGYDATGTAEICERAGVSKGAFYHHFASKQALFLALLDRWLGQLDVHMDELHAGETGVRNTLLHMAGFIEQALRGPNPLLPIFLEFWARAARDPEARAATVATYRRYRDMLAAVIQAGVDEGSIRPVSAVPTAQAVIATAVGLILQGLLDPQGSDWESVAVENLNILLAGLERSHPS